MADATAAGGKWIPFYRRRWFIIVCLLTISPIALLPLLTGKIYRKQSGEGNWIPVKGSSRIIYIFLSLWLVAAAIYGAMNQSEIQTASNTPSGGDTTDTTTLNSNTGSADNSGADLDTGDLKVQVQPLEGFGTTILITSTSDTPIVITRLMVNNRDKVAGCDFSQAMDAQNSAYYRARTGNPYQFPTGKVLKTGDQLSFLAGSECGALVKADVFTNRGKAAYTFGED